MAGSQLKKLKADLKANGMIGQTNVKKKNKKSKTPADTRRDDKKEVLDGIRNKYNIFDSRINRVKRDVTTIQNGHFVKLGDEDVKNPSKSNSYLNKNLKLQYDMNKRQKGRNGRIIDKRFGENNNHLSNEEKMLERFTRERESQNRKNKFSLDSDNEYEDEDEDGFQLTHSGKALASESEGDEDEDEVEDTGPKYVDEDSIPKKKTKKEVMQEIINKSKFHKHERQKLFNKTQDDINDLDDDFQDIMKEIQTAPNMARPQFSNKTEEEKNYDTKVRELVYDKRSAPADRTKTEEEIKREYEERMQKLENDRLRRMEGDRDAEGDDLDDFWEESDSEQSDSEQEGGDRDEEEEEVEEEKPGSVTMPVDLEQFTHAPNKVDYVNNIIKTYKPHLAAGNKEKMDKFVGILFKYIITSESDEKDALIKILKQLSESYNQQLVEVIRQEMEEIQQRITNKALTSSDLIYFNLTGMIFSTSDKYHLVVIPNLILMNEILNNFIYQDLNQNQDIKLVGQAIFIMDTLLNYQRLSKRFIPEVLNTILKALHLLNPQHEFKLNIKHGQPKEIKPISITKLGSDDDDDKIDLVNKLYVIIDRLTNIYKDYSIMGVFYNQVMGIMQQFNDIGDNKFRQQLIEKLDKIITNINRSLQPLELQHHRKIAIPTYQPKFEENFNPDKKSYDLDVERQEINKIKLELKKEKKAAVKEIRRENKFEANERIQEKTKMYADYHKKMADIVNSISTVEGQERNQYEKEKRQRRER